jgi:ferredoxin-NADP reductase/CRP-like cAMP-binding protein
MVVSYPRYQENQNNIGVLTQLSKDDIFTRPLECLLRGLTNTNSFNTIDRKDFEKAWKTYAVKNTEKSNINWELLLKESGFAKRYDHPIPSEFIKKCQILKVRKGDIFFKTGDESNQIYLIIYGKVALFTLNGKGEEQILAEKNDNEYFGEDAILNLDITKREMTARALQETECLILPVDELKRAYEFSSKVEELIFETGMEDFFKELKSSFKSIHESTIDVSKVDGKRKKYIDREVIYFQHEKADYTYYIVSGAVDIRSEELDEKDKILLSLEPEEIFGELAVLNDTERLATAVARGETELILIEKKIVKQLYKNNPQFQKVIKALKGTYDLPQGGRVKRYSGVFHGIPAICNQVTFSKEKTVVSYQILGNDIFCISVQGVEKYEPHFFTKNVSEKREIWIKDGVLVGAINYGHWEDNSAFAQMIFHETKISSESIDHFLKTGTLLEKGLIKSLGNILCQCMQVTYKKAASFIADGANSMEQIVKCTGAGSVCGACKMNIQELLGSNVWKLCQLSKIIKHNDQVASFQFTPLNSKEKVSFRPGQHVVLRFHIKQGWVERPYTLTSHPDDNFYELTVKREDKGLLSSWLFDHAKEGSISYLSDPIGEYTFELPLQKPTILFAGGIGVTPAIVMGKVIKEYGQHAFCLDYSYRSPKDMIYGDFFKKLMATFPYFKLHLRETSKQGRLSLSDIQQRLEAFDNPDVYICGPAEFNQEIKKILTEELKIAPEKIFIEEFTHVGGPRRTDV